jgi:hypothetical protein
MNDKLPSSSKSGNIILRLPKLQVETPVKFLKLTCSFHEVGSHNIKV